MDSHGSRVKKYGIYIDQLVEKIKTIQTCSQELFDNISNQTSSLIEETDHEERSSPSVSIASASEKLGVCLNEVQEILENFYEEE